MKEFLVVNWPSIVIISVFLIIVLVLVIQKRWDVLRQIAYKMMLAAEMAYASGEGRAKFEFVFTQVYSIVPAWFKVFVPENILRRKLQDWFNLAKDWADDGLVNGSTGGDAQ